VSIFARTNILSHHYGKSSLGVNHTHLDNLQGLCVFMIYYPVEFLADYNVEQNERKLYQIISKSSVPEAFCFQVCHCPSVSESLSLCVPKTLRTPYLKNTGVNATGDAGDASPAIFRQLETEYLISPQSLSVVFIIVNSVLTVHIIWRNG